MFSIKKKILKGVSEIKKINKNNDENLKELDETEGFTLFNSSLKEIFNIKNESSQTLIKYGLLYVFIIGITLFLSNLVTKKKVFDTDTYLYISIFILPILVIIGLIVFSSRSQNTLAIFMYAALGLFLLVFIVQFYSNIKSLSGTYQHYLTLFTQVIIISLVVVGFTLFYNVFSDKLQRIPGTIGIVVNLIFFIPCLINDFIIYIKNQFKITPSVTYILLVFEFLLVFAYIYLPSLFSSSFYNSHKLLNEPVFLNAYKVIGHGEDIPMNNKMLVQNSNFGEINAPTPYVNYSMSMWLYLNSQDLSTKNKHIFSYGDDKLCLEYISIYSDQSNEILSETLDKKHKVKITFVKDSDCNKLRLSLEENENYASDLVNIDDFYSKYNTMCRPIPKNDFEIMTNVNDDNEVNWREFLDSQGKQEIYIFVDFELQKWNNIVVNYDSNNVDLFINGELTYSQSYVNMFPKYKETDRISVGNSDLQGAICNIEYHENVMSKADIVANYNLLLNKNPPLNNIV
jgi:hypothetical protein